MIVFETEKTRFGILPHMTRPAVHYITTPKAWAVYIAPARVELVEAMRMIAPCSIAEIAAAIDRPADTLYRHVDKLRKIGVIVEAGVRRAGRRFEQVFDLAGDDFRPQFRDNSPRAANKMFNDTMRSITKILLRTTRDAVAAEQIVFEPDRRNAMVKFEHAWLTPAEVEQLREMFLGIKRFMDARKSRREGRLYLAAFAMVPVHRKRRARVSVARSASRGAAKPAPRAASASKPAVRKRLKAG
jgi:DNA-binding transcriptional ArsR family regulator